MRQSLPLSPPQSSTEAGPVTAHRDGANANDREATEHQRRDQSDHAVKSRVLFDLEGGRFPPSGARGPAAS
jgi:hypothetical protein